MVGARIQGLPLFKISKMRNTTVVKSFIALLAFSSSTAALWGLSYPINHQQRPLKALPNTQQSIMDKLIPDILKPSEDLSGKADGPIIADVLPKTKGINIFAQLTRDFDPIASRLNDPSKNITVLAPRNSAIQALPRKPWEDPADYATFGEVKAYEGEEGQDRARRNLHRFVDAHLIPTSPWREGEVVETLGGEKLKWTKQGDKIIVSSFRGMRIAWRY